MNIIEALNEAYQGHTVIHHESLANLAICNEFGELVWRDEPSVRVEICPYRAHGWSLYSEGSLE